MPRDEAFCTKALGWLDAGERAALTGWSGRLARAVAHLADAWCIADGDNAPRVERALAMLLEGQRPATVETMELLMLQCAGGALSAGGRGTELVMRVRGCVWGRES